MEKKKTNDEKIPTIIFRKRLILDGKVSGYGDRYDTLEQLLKEAKQLGHMNERKHDEVELIKKMLLICDLFTNTALFLISSVRLRGFHFFFYLL